jgi:hypothetical protein
MDLLFDWTILQIKTKIVSCYTADSKPVKQEANRTMILSPLVFPGLSVVMLNVIVLGVVAPFANTWPRNFYFLSCENFLFVSH